MTPVESEGRKEALEAGVSLREWILLPLTGVLTICILVIGGNSIAAKRFGTSKTTTMNCLVTDNPSRGVTAIPNSVCYQKNNESRLEEYRFNSCGHRAGMECGPKRPGTYRVVLMGSSFGYGMWVQRDRSFAALLPIQLSHITGQNVELYNESMQYAFPRSAAARFDEVLAANPDMILWALTPIDIQSAADVLPDLQNPVAKLDAWNKIKFRAREAFANRTVLDGMTHLLDKGVEQFSHSPLGVALQCAVYESRSQYVKSYLMGPDEEQGFLKAELSGRWKSDLRQFESVVAGVAARAQTAGVPLVFVLLPNRAQSAMVSMGEWPGDFDPYRLDNELHTIIAGHGATYVDILPDYRAVSVPEQGYFAVDGHPNDYGHEVISRLLAKELTTGSIPSLKAGMQVASEKGR
jgi:hypothetical protein